MQRYPPQVQQYPTTTQTYPTQQPPITVTVVAQPPPVQTVETPYRQIQTEITIIDYILAGVCGLIGVILMIMGLYAQVRFTIAFIGEGLWTGIPLVGGAGFAIAAGTSKNISMYGVSMTLYIIGCVLSGINIIRYSLGLAITAGIIVNPIIYAFLVFFVFGFIASLVSALYDCAQYCGWCKTRRNP